MNVRPPKIVAELVRWCIPSADREHVLGDLHERLQSAGDRPGWQYALDALSTVPLVVWSRMRRVASQPGFRAQAMMVVVAFFTAAFRRGGADPSSFFIEQHGLRNIALPVIAALLSLLIGDTYGDPVPEPAHHLRRTAAAIATAWLAILAVDRSIPSWALPQPIVPRALVLGFLLVSWARFFFAFRGLESALDRAMPQTASGIRERALQLEEAIRRRTRLGYAITIFVAVACVWMLRLAQHPLQRAGMALIVFASLYLARQISRYRSGPAPVDTSYEGWLSFYRDELARQRDFHRGKAFWIRLAMSIPGPLLFSLGAVATHPTGARRATITAVVFLALAATSVPVNFRAARRYERRLREAAAADQHESR